MHLKFDSDEQKFREELQSFFTTKIPEEIRQRAAAGTLNLPDDIVTTQRILNAEGLATPGWPSEWGGRDWTPIQRNIYHDQLLSLIHI